MPRSKRSQVTTLSKTPLRSTKESKAALVTQLRAAIDQYDHVWIFSVGDMRNDGLKQVRAQWRGSGRFFFGKDKVMAKALGSTPETEYQTDLANIAQVGQHSSNTNASDSKVRLESLLHPIPSTKPSSGSTRTKKPSIQEWAGGPLQISHCQKVHSNSTSLTRRTHLDPVHHSSYRRPLPPFHGASASSTRSLHHTRSRRPFVEQPPHHLQTGRKAIERKVSNIKTSRRPNGRTSLLLYIANLQEFRITLGSRWSKEGGFVEGRNVTLHDSDDEMA